MNLLQMSLSGAVLIVVVIFIRALTINVLPKTTFLMLWGIILFRLLVPFSISSTFSVYSLIEKSADYEGQMPSETVISANGQNHEPDESGVSIYEEDHDAYNAAFSALPNVTGPKDNAVGAVSNVVDKTDTGVSFDKGWHRHFGVKFIIWFIGMAAYAMYFTVFYLRCWFEFQTSLPVENVFTQQWLKGHSRRRSITIRQSDRISTPLTYGILHPVILMPKNTDWNNTEKLQYILMHEYVHICRYDTLTKLIVVSALCIHWFNPMVWLMYILFNRDVEISCDESVVRHMGETSKSAYAMMLIRMEAERGSLTPLCSGLLSKIGKNAMEERITAIMKIKKKSTLVGIVAAVLVISVAATFATSATEAAETMETRQDDKTIKETEAAERNKQENMTESQSTTPKSVTDFTEEEYEMLLTLKFDGYEDMSISEFRNKVWALTDTEEYNDIIDRFFQDETIYAVYETKKGTDSNETYDFLYNVLGPIMGEQPISFSGCAQTDFASALENASLEYTGTLTILDADRITVGEYMWARQGIVDDMEIILQDLSVTELRDEELMKVFIDEAVMNTIMTYQYNVLQVAVEYSYKPLNGVSVDDMDDWQKERRDEWDRLLAPYVPFGLSYRYHWDMDDYKMYFNGKEVRGIYDEEKNLWISEHQGIGKGIYDENATELFVVYENHKIVGLREATAQELEEITARRQVVTDSYERNQENFQYIREYVPATKDDYESFFTLKTSDYRQKSIADFDMGLLEWSNENHEQIERIQCDRSWNDYRVAMTDEERSFVELTAWLSEIENTEYVRSLNKNEPAKDICIRIHLSNKEEYAQNGYGLAWCSLDYSFSYHIFDKEKVSIGERDDQISKIVHEIQDYWDSSDIDEILQMTKSDMLEWIQSIATKYSNRNITITISDDQTYFECMDERYEYAILSN